MVTQLANIMDWQPFTWREVLQEWPYASLQLVMSRVAENARKQAKSRGPDQGFTSLDTNSAASPSDVMARLESRAVVVNPNTLTEG